MVSTISQAFLVYIALTQWSGSGLIWLSCIVLFGTLTEYSVFCFYVFFCEGILQIRRGYFSWSMLKELYVFGFNSTLLMAADRIQRQSSPLIVSHILGVSQVVFFSIPRRLVDYGKDLGLALGYPLMPFFSSIESRGDADAMREEWFVASRWLQLATLALPIGLLGMGERFLGLWMGPDYAIQGRWVIVFLSLALFIEGLTPNAGRMLVASGKHARPARILLVLSVLSIGVSIVFAKWYRIPGLAFAVMWANAVGSGIQWFLVSPLIRVGLWEHVRRTVGPLMAPMALMATAIWLLAQCLPSHHMAWLCAQGAVSGILYMVAAWFFVANASEKLRVKVWLREKVFHASSKKEISAA
jgi:O-antigen/teichoic acid export membrane protein